MRMRAFVCGVIVASAVGTVLWAGDDEVQAAATAVTSDVASRDGTVGKERGGTPDRKASPWSGVQGCAADADPFLGEDFPDWDQFSTGYLFGFRAELAGKAAPTGDVFGAGTHGVSRVIMDPQRGVYAGYTLLVAQAPEDQPFTVTIKPLDESEHISKKLAELAPKACPACPPYRALDARLARYPEPFTITSGTTFVVDLLVNPKTGERLTDTVKIVRTGQSKRDGNRVKADMELIADGAGDGKTLTGARVCIRDLETGKLLTGRPWVYRFASSGAGCWGQGRMIRIGGGMLGSVLCGRQSGSFYLRNVIRQESGEPIYIGDFILPDSAVLSTNPSGDK